MADHAMVQFLVQQLESFSREQLFQHLTSEGHEALAVNEALNEAEAIRSAPERGFFGGRMSRQYFAVGFGICVLIELALKFTMPGFALLLSPLIGIGIFLASIPRIHDLGRTGWWSLMLLVPPLNIALIIGLLARAGDETANPFGPPPS